MDPALDILSGPERAQMLAFCSRLCHLPGSCSYGACWLSNRMPASKGLRLSLIHISEPTRLALI
eukprot:11679851-Alexandrium_andersonii.AAC.1